MRGRGFQSLADLAGRVDGDRILGALLLVGVLGAGLFVLVAGTAPLSGLADALFLVAWLLPVVGFVLAVAALWAFLRGSGGETPPGLVETVDREYQVAGDLGDELSQALDRAHRNRYVGLAASRSQRIHDLLVEAVTRTVRTRDGLDRTSARGVVTEGSWTDDRVAAAFLSRERRLPLLERLRGFVDPGRAYRRRVDRTLDAIDRLEATPAGRETADDGQAESATDGADESDSTAETERRTPDGHQSGAERPLTETVFDGRLEQGTREQRGAIWGGMLAVLLAGLGVAAGQPVLVVGATLGLWHAAASVVAGPTGASLALTRRVSMDSGDPGDRVTVETTVRNTGDEPLVDLRVVDGVPDDLPVQSGSSRACLSLAPGEAAQLTYELELRRGEFAFSPVALRRSSLAGLSSERWAVGAGSDQRLRCVPAVEQVPLGEATNDYAGEVPTDEGGSGVEFYSVREYEPGDPVGSIDWRRYAHTRDLATVEYRAERATRVVCVVDCRESQRRTATGTGLPARDISVAAARRTASALLGVGHPTGLATIEEGRIQQVDPATGRETRTTVEELLDAQLNGHEAPSGPIRSITGNPATTLPGTLPGETQVFLFSSLVDRLPVDLTAQLRSQGFGVTVVSPDVTAGSDDTAVRLVGLERDDRLLRTRASGARVVDWDADRPLGHVLDAAIRGVSG
jgi:uncharacterized repeat protein (TIGR01451 family)